MKDAVLKLSINKQAVLSVAGDFECLVYRMVVYWLHIIVLQNWCANIYLNLNFEIPVVIGTGILFWYQYLFYIYYYYYYYYYLLM